MAEFLTPDNFHTNPELREILGEDCVNKLKKEQLEEAEWNNLDFKQKIKACGIRPDELEGASKLALILGEVLDYWVLSNGILRLERDPNTASQNQRIHEKIHPITGNKIVYICNAENNDLILRFSQLVKAISVKSEDKLELNDELVKKCKQFIHFMDYLGNVLRNAYSSGQESYYISSHKYFFGNLDLLKDSYASILKMA